jgi:hypothetical protein
MIKNDKKYHLILKKIIMSCIGKVLMHLALSFMAKYFLILIFALA